MGKPVPDVAGRDVGAEPGSYTAFVADSVRSQKRGGKDPTRDLLTERLARQQAPGSVDFEPVVFHAFVKAARIVPGGEVEIVLSVEPSQKYAALPITDAADFMVKITAERVVRDE